MTVTPFVQLGISLTMRENNRVQVWNFGDLELNKFPKSNIIDWLAGILILLNRVSFYLEDSHSGCEGFGWGMMGVWRGCFGKRKWK